MTEKKDNTHRRLPICTLGAAGHGKTTLTAAIAKVVAENWCESIQMEMVIFEAQHPN